MMTEKKAKAWIEEVTKDFMEIGYTYNAANSLAWAKFFEFAPKKG